MKRLLFLPALLFMLMLCVSHAPAEDTAQMAQDLINTGIRYYEEAQNETYTNQTKLDEAVKVFTEALRLDPGSARARYRLGLTCLAMDNKACAENQYRLLKGLDEGMAEALKAKISGHKAPQQFQRIGITGSQWEPPAAEKTPPSKTAAPEPAESTPPPATGGKACEIVNFSTYDGTSEIRLSAAGSAISQRKNRCVTATIRNMGAQREPAANFVISARFSDGDTLKSRITNGISTTSAVEPGETVSGSACFDKDKATITVVDCGLR